METQYNQTTTVAKALPEVGAMLTLVDHWNGKTRYYRVTGYATLPGFEFFGGENLFLAGKGETVPVAVECFKSGKAKAWPECQIHSWKEAV